MTMFPFLRIFFHFLHPILLLVLPLPLPYFVLEVWPHTMVNEGNIFSTKLSADCSLWLCFMSSFLLSFLFYKFCYHFMLTFLVIGFLYKPLIFMPSFPSFYFSWKRDTHLGSRVYSKLIIHIWTIRATELFGHWTIRPLNYSATELFGH